MPRAEKARMSIWVEAQDRDDMAAIREAFGLPTDSSAIRFAIRKIAREIRGQDQAPKRAA
jgi:hypothetical protein